MQHLSCKAVQSHGSGNTVDGGEYAASSTGAFHKFIFIPDSCGVMLQKEGDETGICMFSSFFFF